MNEHTARVITDDVSIVLCGEAGQGIQTVERLLSRVFRVAGLNVFAVKEYMSRVRGGENSTEIRVASKRRHAFVRRIDILIPLDKDALPHLAERITGGTIILGDREKLEPDRPIIDVPFTKIATEVGSPLYANTVAVGLILGLFRIEIETLNGLLGEMFAKKGEAVVAKNREAGKRGYDIGLSLSGPGKIEIRVERHPEVKNEPVLSGADAISIGAIAGGCDFLAAYPMTPSTGILTFISQHAAKFGIIAEQAEDEISAVNMAIGAWYAGARAMVCTAGGGFALMVEGLSLAGMTESPLVLSVGMRPAPATGLPTRTEQGDLLYALFTGHGEFPRIILSPGTLEECVSLSHQAFNLADRFQVPVIILSDQYLVDTYYNIPGIDTEGLAVERSIVRTDANYLRYRFTENGISPRGIPGNGDGTVNVDSDEHYEDGRITEDMAIRKKMVEKRLKKLDSLIETVVPPVLGGAKDYDTLIVGWGSTEGVINEAVENLGLENAATLHFSQVHPLHPSAAGYLKRAKKLVIVENNATCQFGKLIKLDTGIDIQNKVLKYDGMPFSVEELTDRLKEIVGEKLRV